MVGDEVRAIIKSQVLGDLVATVKTLVFIYAPVTFVV